MRNAGFDEAAIGHGGNVVAGGEIAGDELFVIIELVRFNALSGHHIITIHIDLNSIKIVQAFLCGQVGGPIIFHAGIGDGSTRIDMGNLIWARAEWWGKGGFFEGDTIIIIRHSRGSGNLRQFRNIVSCGLRSPPTRG